MTTHIGDLETQLSIISYQAPPTYEHANKQLQPDVAPLPKIDNVNITDNNPVEGGCGPLMK